MPRYQTAIHWFRRDLRLSDNPALHRAAEEAETVVPVYVPSGWKGTHAWTGPGRQAFLCGALASLSRNLGQIGGQLFVRRGNVPEVLEALLRECRAEAIFFNRDPDPHGRAVEGEVRSLCRAYGIECRDFQDAVLHGPDAVLTGAGQPYKVYTPYSRQWFSLPKPSPVPTVKRLRSPNGLEPGVLPGLSDWGLPDPGPLLREPGERAARSRMRAALAGAVLRYAERRDDPAADATSHLGADLRYGTLSVRELFHRTEEARRQATTGTERESVLAFQKQLAWREFFMSILGHFPEVLETDFHPEWRGLEWDDPGSGDRLVRWEEGRTGFPLVDAGMRQLKETGYMHNRVRMVVAMFLTKDLHLHWRLGEAHFMRHLLDGEIANNNGGWQWSAGTGADAAPYFRIQNPWTQSARHDPQGEYIRRWVPELAPVDPKRLHAPPESGQRLCPDYVAPMVDHRREREETLDRFQRHRAKRMGR